MSDAQDLGGRGGFGGGRGGGGGRPQRGIQRLFEVVRSERIAPQLVRLHLTGDDFDAFVENAGREKLALTDKYVKFLFARPELGLEPPYDLEALRAQLAPGDLPVRRTYTIRSIDFDAKTIAVDFVVHGDEGLAGPWALRARPGDKVVFSGPGARYHPDQGDDVTHVIIADDSAIPAAAAAIDALPPAAKGIALIEVPDENGHVELNAPAGLEVRWIHRDGAPYGVPLAEAVEALERPAGAIDAFAHGEREAVKRIGAVLHGVWGIDRQEMSISAYWAYGRTEDGFQEEKRSPVGQIL
ncbi:MAG: siderophore-interacting protein [Microbacterium sp.]|uniref:siderophore-interacting protein n=1 Tax=Microbacterium sp. TaxID=51671 RepID=UPI0039E417BC